MSPRILVVGGGAIGGVAAAKTTLAGHDVTVLDADRDHVAAMTAPGLLFDDVTGETRRVPLTAVSDADALTGTFELVLVTVKATALEAALAPLVERGLGGAYVALGNGLMYDRVESLVGRGNLVVGLVEWGATNLGPGHLRQTTDAPTVVGELEGSSTDRLQTLRGVLSSIAEARTTSTIMGQVWTKLLLNSTFSGLGAVGGMVYQEIVADPVGREVAVRLWREGHDVATALGMPLSEVFGVLVGDLVRREPGDDAAVGQALDRLMRRAGPTKASMLQDLERSRRTEVDVINGGVVAAARAAGLDAPLNAEVTRIVHQIEDGVWQPRASSFRRLQKIGDVRVG